MSIGTQTDLPISSSPDLAALHQCPGIVAQNDFIDSGIYIFNHCYRRGQHWIWKEHERSHCPISINSAVTPQIAEM